MLDRRLSPRLEIKNPPTLSSDPLLLLLLHLCLRRRHQPPPQPSPLTHLIRRLARRTRSSRGAPPPPTPPAGPHRRPRPLPLPPIHLLRWPLRHFHRPIRRATFDQKSSATISSSWITEISVAAAAASGGGDDAGQCTIRNLDTGGEFVVADDGERSELLGVGTGRKLTMEEFEMCAERSPIMQELMRPQTEGQPGDGGVGGTLMRSKKRGGWLLRIKNTVAGWLRSIKNTVTDNDYHQRTRSFDERDTSSERRSGSVTKDHGAHWVKVRQYGKTKKELNCLYMIQETQAHSDTIWGIKFSLNGEFRASTGEDCVIHVWRLTEQDMKGDVEENGNCSPFVARVADGSPEAVVALTCVQGSHWEKKRRAKLAGGRKSASLDQVLMPEQVFALSDKPVCTSRGHLNDILYLSWSKLQMNTIKVSNIMGIESSHLSLRHLRKKMFS